MKKLIAFSSAILITSFLHAQYSFKAIIKDEKGRQPLPGVTVLVKGINRTAVADSMGSVDISNIRW